MGRETRCTSCGRWVPEPLGFGGGRYDRSEGGDAIYTGRLEVCDTVAWWHYGMGDEENYGKGFTEYRILRMKFLFLLAKEDLKE